MAKLAVLQTPSFQRWLAELPDLQARGRILARLRMASGGHLGDVEAIGRGVSEMRVHAGPGYRLYFVRRREAVILLCAGDKSSQHRDIRRARAMAQELLSH